MPEINWREFGERFKEARLSIGLSQAKLGELIDAEQSRISAIESGDQLPTTKQLVQALTVFQRSANWLLMGAEDIATIVREDQTDYGVVTMPVLAMGGAGAPCCIESLEPIGHIKVQRELDGPNIKVIKIKGASMEPTMLDGSYVGVDVTDKSLVSGKLYAVYLPYEGVVVKRIWIGLDLIKIESDNKTAPSHDMSIDRINWDTFMLGRVKWWIAKEN